MDEVQKEKRFDRQGFATFLRVNKSARDFDPVSGVLRFGGKQVIVSKDGVVDGDYPFTERVQKWIHEFMSA